MKNFIVLSFAIILCGCTPSLVEQENKKGVELANPASTFCIEKGGELKIHDEEGGQVGYCHLKDGSEIEEWKFFRENNIKEQVEPQIPEGCETWFDGCNNCMVGKKGIMACTRKMCFPGGEKEPKCIKFKEEDGIDEEPVACTLEAKVCPNGSTVGRTGPDCEFTSCPLSE